MKYALIINEAVHEIFDTDPRYPRGMDVRQVGDNVQVGWTVTKDGKASPPKREETGDVAEMAARLPNQIIEQAYLGKRTSAYGYYAHLTAKKVAGGLSPEQQRHFDILHQAAEWEEDVIGRAKTFGSVLEAAQPDAWPAPPPGLLEVVKDC